MTGWRAGPAMTSCAGVLGRDTLTGGAGADLFEFLWSSDSATAPAGMDTVTDFNPADGDRIDLSAIDAATGQAGNQSFAWITTAFTGTAGELHFVTQGTICRVEADLDGDAGPISPFCCLTVQP